MHGICPLAPDSHLLFLRVTLNLSFAAVSKFVRVLGWKVQSARVTNLVRIRGTTEKLDMVHVWQETTCHHNP